jgi:CheY-like chemotaxis protein
MYPEKNPHDDGRWAATGTEALHTIFGTRKPSLEPTFLGTASESVTTNPRIVIIDDEPINIRVVRRMLMLAGYKQFFTTTDPAAALELIRSTQPDVVLLDIMMPCISGLDVLRQLREDEEFVDLPVIILTAATLRRVSGWVAPTHSAFSPDAGLDLFLSAGPAPERTEARQRQPPSSIGHVTEWPTGAGASLASCGSASTAICSVPEPRQHFRLFEAQPLIALLAKLATIVATSQVAELFRFCRCVEKLPSKLEGDNLVLAVWAKSFGISSWPTFERESHLSCGVDLTDRARPCLIIIPTTPARAISRVL